MKNIHAIIIGAAKIIAALLFQYFSDYKTCARKWWNNPEYILEYCKNTK